MHLFTGRWFAVSLVFAALLVWVGASAAMGLERSTNGEPGTLGHDDALLVSNRTVTPAGHQSSLGDLPLNAILSPDGKHLLVTNGGAGIQSLQVVSTEDGSITQSIEYLVPDSVFIGLAFSPDGKRAYASGGGFDVVHAFNVGADARLTKAGDIHVGTLATNPFPTGLSISPDGKTLYVAENLAKSVALVDTTSQLVVKTIAVGSYPYTTLITRDGRKIYVSNWGDATLSVIDASTGTVSKTIAVGKHPSAMALGPGTAMYVADSNSDAVSVIDTVADTEVARVSLSPYSNAPLSSSPEGLAVSPDGQRLYVADAGADEVSVIGLGAHGLPSGGVLGRIPTAWYPTSVVVSGDGETLFVTNAKGLGAGPNDSGFYPNPARTTVPFIDGIGGYADGYCNCTFDNYTGSMIQGTLSTIQVPASGLLAVYTHEVERNNRHGDASILQRSAGNPIPLPGHSSPIKHVIYVIKENRTYDQVFSDLPVGDGASNLLLFPQSNTPNEHALAKRFGVLDNFYADAEVSADGHNWITSANASDYNEKMWPQDYSAGVGRNRGYDFEGVSTINLSPGGYLWDAAAKAGISLRDYGEFTFNSPASSATLIPASAANTCTGPVAHSYIGKVIPAGMVLCFGPTFVNPATTPNLVGKVDPRMRGYDLRYTESDRVAEWQREFAQYEAGNNLPSLEIMRLPNDHTAGTRAGFPTPQAFVAENDVAVGQLVETVSHSKDWASTAIFITEDDAQNGPDHVDSHRTTSLVISPYTSRTNLRADHTLYDTAAMVRTMELILGLAPLSQFDANAVPMWRLFTTTPDTTPYTTLAPGTSMSDTNTDASFGASQSAAMDFSEEDRAPSDELNRVIWGSVKGADAPYPSSN